MMKIRMGAAALTVAAALTLAGCADTTSTMPEDMPGMDHGDTSSATAEFNDADVMFAQMMIPHHEQAVEMSDMILAKDNINDRVITLAEQIKAAQEPEIAQLEEWLDAWGAEGEMGDMDGMDHGGGMMSEEDMADLEAATGDEASRLFLEQMIVHHEGAIEMAQEQVDNGQNPDAIEMAQTIIDSQTEEIATMEEILNSL